jgi:hypothetical protein
LPTPNEWYQVYRGQQLALEQIAKDVAKLTTGSGGGGAGGGDGTIPFLRHIADRIDALGATLSDGLIAAAAADPTLASVLTVLRGSAARTVVSPTGLVYPIADSISNIADALSPYGEESSLRQLIDAVAPPDNSVAGALDKVASAIQGDPLAAHDTAELARLTVQALKIDLAPGSPSPAEHRARAETYWENFARRLAGLWAGEEDPALRTATLTSMVSPGIKAGAGIAEKILAPLQEPFRVILTEGIDRLFANIAAASKANPNDPTKVAIAGILSAHKLGQAAHGLAIVAEAHPLFHSLGFAQLAAAVVDLSGFAPMSQAALRPYIEAAIARPMRYTTNAQFVPYIPGENTLADHVRRRTLNLTDYDRWLSLLGYAETHRDRMIETVWRDPTIRDLALALEDAKVDEEWLLRRVRTAGYDDTDADQITRGLLQRANKASRERLRASSAGAYAEGTISGEEYETILADVGLSDDAVRWERRAAELQRRRDAVKDAIATYRRQYTSDQITRDDYALALTALGVDPERLAALLADADSTRAPRVQREEEAQVAAALSELRRELVPRYRKLYDLGLVGAEEYQRMLEQAGIAPAVAAQAVSLDAARLRAAAAATGSAAAERQLAELLRERQDLAVQQYRRGLLTDDQLAAALLAAGRPADQADAVVAQERLLRVPILARPPAIPAEATDRLTPEFTRRAAILDFRGGLLTPDELAVALIATGYTTAQAEAATDYELARLPAPKA